MRTRVLTLTAAMIATAMIVTGAPAFAGSVHLTGNLSADFFRGPSAQQIIETFSGSGQPPFSGVGWEVILGRVGFGGEYNVNFFRAGQEAWWLDWFAQPLFLSYHPLRRGTLLDPFVQAGIGSAGRVYLNTWTGSAARNLYLSIFPFVAGGLSLDLSGFLLTAKVSYAPFMSPPPATVFDTYPLGSVQVSLGAGIAIDW